jgi:uncharacterized cupredoxin-like copper-binding protein
MSRRSSPTLFRVALFMATAGAVVAISLAGCDLGPATAPPLSPGSSAHPREVNVIAKDYLFIPAELALVPGETVLLHVINGGLEPHEAVIGDSAVQAAWEAAEAPTATHPPGPTAVIQVPAGVAGLRLFVASGQRVDVLWTVPPNAASTPGGWLLGCHIPGHFARGMVAAIRFVGPGREPLPSALSASPAAASTSRAIRAVAAL